MSRTQGRGHGARGSGAPPIEIRRACSADQAAFGEFFCGLSAHTRYLRFFAPITPTGAMLRYLSGRGGHGVDAVVAIGGGVIVGHGMGVDRAGPGGDVATDIGVVVGDAWQGQGVGPMLIRALVSRAQARGSAFLTMDVLHGNERVMAMITGHWPSAHTFLTSDGVAVRIQLPKRHPHPAGHQGPRQVLVRGLASGRSRARARNRRGGASGGTSASAPGQGRTPPRTPPARTRRTA